MLKYSRLEEGLIMTKKGVFVYLFLIVLSVLSSFYIYDQSYVERDFSKIDLDKVNNLMIVAHPDDEVLFGGAHLLKDDYLVVCITCGINKTRVHEFQRAMKATNDQFLMLGYPDKVLGIRSNWKEEKTLIYKDIYNLLAMKNWNIIVTHNYNGEYGHQHHIMTNRIVTEAYNDLNKSDSLYFFGQYYTKSKLSKLEIKPERIEDKYLEEKTEILDLYKSQSFIKNTFGHIFPYEDWISYDNIIS